MDIPNNDDSRNDLVGENQISDLLQQVGSRNNPPDILYDQIKSNVKSVWQEEVNARRTKRNAYSVAAGFALAVAIGTATFLASNNKVNSYATVDGVVNQVEYLRQGDDTWRDLKRTEVNGVMKVRTHANSFVSISMINGLNVRLAENSDVTLVGIDEINLKSGNLYIDSNDHADVQNSIWITTPFGQARDIGTQFAVRVMPDNWQIQVREGSVEINHGDIVALAGDRILISESNIVRKSTIDPDDMSWDWTQEVVATFHLEGATLSTYLNWVSRETGKPLEYRSEVARKQATSTMLHGSIEGLKPLESLPVVISTTDFHRVDAEPDRIVIGI